MESIFFKEREDDDRFKKKGGGGNHLMRERGTDERQTDLFSVTYPDPEIQ